MKFWVPVHLHLDDTDEELPVNTDTSTGRARRTTASTKVNNIVTNDTKAMQRKSFVVDVW